MDDPHKYASLPIPSYEEAISLRPSSSQNHRGPGEISDDAERQGLLGQNAGYQPPIADSPRSSEDSDLRLPEVNGDDRRQIEELDYLDPSQDATSSPRDPLIQPCAVNWYCGSVQERGGSCCWDLQVAHHSQMCH